MNHLTSGLSSRFGAFADDYKVYLDYNAVDGGSDGITTLQRDYNSIYTISSSWNLNLNSSKCVATRFSRKFAGWNELGSDWSYHVGDCFRFFGFT